jgi:hypothetical protein
MVFRIYSDEEQDTRCTNAVNTSGQGNVKKVKPNGGAKCEYCGLTTQSWDWFWWRLYGLCSSCFNLSEQGYSPDFVLSPKQHGKPVSRWGHLGGRDESGVDEK